MALPIAKRLGAAAARTAIGTLARGNRRVTDNRADRPCAGDVPHVGVVFVHGIGSQAEGETLREWSRPIIDVIGDVRVRAGLPADPVVRTWVDRRASGNREIEIEVPSPSDAEPDGREHWVMTEAWWAADVASPSFATMVEWLGPGGALRRVGETLLPGHPNPGVESRKRDHLEPDLLDGGASASDPSPSLEPARARPARDRAWAASTPAARVAVGALLQAFSTLILVLYGALRAIERLIPIGPLKDRVLTGAIDNFMLDWFGDVFVLLGDPGQAAGIRARLTSAIETLNARRCRRVVVVAHSGGAIVSYMTLADPANDHLRVDRLVTLGEGLNLARQIAAGDLSGPAAEEATLRYAAIFRSIRERRPKLQWTDFWASQDPAPVGPVQRHGDGAQVPIESMAVWNRLELLGDHGTYWDNVEEFLVPLVRRIGSAELDGADSALFDDAAARRCASEGRRRRLAVLSLWRQLTGLAALSSVLTAFATQHGFVDRVGRDLGGLVDSIPGREIITGPLGILEKLLVGASPGFADFAVALGTNILAGGVAIAILWTLVNPPERSAAWRSRPEGATIDYLILLVRAAGIELLGFALVLYLFHLAPSDALGVIGQVVPAVLAVGALAVGATIVFFVATWMAHRMRSHPTFRNLVVVASMALALAGVAAVVAAVALDQALGRDILAVAFVVAVGGLIRSVGVSRWDAWDRREAIRVRRQLPPRRLPWTVVVQAALLLACLGGFWVIVANDFGGVAWAWPAGFGLLAILIGIAIDTAPPDDSNPGGSVTRFNQTSSAS